MSNIDKRALREAADAANKASWGHWVSYHPHKGARGYEVKVGVKAIAQHCLKVDSVFIATANPATVLAPLDELEAADELNKHLELAIRRSEGCSEALRRKLEVAEERIAEHRELLRWAHDTLLEINLSNYTHDDVCEINSASVEVILGIAPVLGETHGKSEEWWAARAAGVAKGE